MELLSQLFAAVFSLSRTAAPVLLVLFLLRLLLRHAPRRYTCALWWIAVFRLLSPVALPSAWSLFNLAPLASSEGGQITALTEMAVSRGLPSVGMDTAATQAAGTPVPTLGLTALLGLLWAAGVAALLLWRIVQALRLRRSLADAVEAEPGVYESPRVSEPFLAGLRRPRIYLPAGLTGPGRACVLAHERAHLRRRDHWTLAVWTVLTAVHWYNPLVWLACRAAARDLETACDEAAVRALGDERRADYSETLLALASGRRDLLPTLTFSAPDVGRRIRHVLTFRRGGRLAVGAAALVLLLACLTCCTGAVTGGWVRCEGGTLEGESFTYSLPRGTESLLVYAELVEDGAVIGRNVFPLDVDGREGTVSLGLEQFREVSAALWAAGGASTGGTGGGYPAGQVSLSLDQPTWICQHDRTGANGETASLQWYLYPSARTREEAEDWLNGGAYAARLYEARVEYVGGASDVGALRDVVFEPCRWQDTTMEFFTAKTPYGLCFHATDSGWAGNAAERERFEAENRRNAALLLALTDNADYYYQTVQTGPEGEVYTARTWTTAELETALGIPSLKEYGRSAEGVRLLLALLEG